MPNPTPSRPRRVLIVSNLFPPHVVGGAEIVAHRQALALHARGHSVSVFAGWVAPTEQAGRLEVETIDGLRVWRMPVVSFDADDNFFAPAVTARLRAVIGAEQPDVVHLHNLNGLGFALVPLVRRLGVPAVVTLHDHAAYCYRATALRPDDSLCTDTEDCAQACRASVRPRDVTLDLPMRLRRDYVAWALGQANRLVSPSRALATAVVASGALDPAPLEVISNGIDPAPFQAAPPRPAATGASLRFLCVAYLGEHKGIPDLLAAAETLAADRTLRGRWSLAIAGDGHLRGRVEAAAASRRYGGALRYLGHVPHARIVAEFARADVVVLPSRWPENEPVVLLEAIAAGRATLATAVGGMLDLVEPGQTGELVPPHAPTALAAAMASYVREPARAHAQGAANRTRRHHFAEATTIAAIEALHARVCDAAAASAPTRPVVLCAGETTPPEVATICASLHCLETPSARVRLLWHAWADAADWETAALLWHWSPNLSHGPVQRALRAGMPVLAPQSCLPLLGIAHSHRAAMIYDDAQQAGLALARLVHDVPALQALRRGCYAAATLLDGTARSMHYDLAATVLGTTVSGT